MKDVAGFVWIFLGVLCVSGCASSSRAPDLEEFSLKQENILFLQPSEIVRMERAMEFIKEHPVWSEQDKIAYLLEMIRISGHLFARNGLQYNGDQASRWLRWKMNHRQYRDDPILTARDFVHRVAVRSIKTGRPYYLYAHRQWGKLEDILDHELRCFEDYLSAHQVSQPESAAEASRDEKSVQAAYESSVLMPSQGALPAAS